MTRASRAPRGLARLPHALAILGTLGVPAVIPASAQQPAPAVADTATLVDAPRWGSEFWIPFGSLIVPGLGQYIHGAPWTGVAYSATTLGGLLASRAAGDLETIELPPRSGRDQFAFEAAHVAVTASFLSAWDAFGRAKPALRRTGKYAFLEQDEDLGDLLTAPLDYRFLGRWTTWIDLAFTGGIVALAVAYDDDGPSGVPIRAHDAAFAASLSLNAAVGEEALFRGWLLPMLTQKLGGRFWWANGIQAWIFGAAHAGQAGPFAFVIGGSALYTGWLTRHNGWSIREGIFQHFWYDVAIVTASLLRDEVGTVSLVPVQIRF